MKCFYETQVYGPQDQNFDVISTGRYNLQIEITSVYVTPLISWYQVVSLTLRLLCTSSVFDHSVSLVSPNVHWMQLVV